jgi:hypothetical protein
MLRTLCDVQIFTALAIIIAGLSQLNTGITFYHQQLIVAYLTFTINSYWLAGQLVDYDSPWLCLKARQFGIWCSFCLGFVFQVIVMRREQWQWADFESGYCYRFHDIYINGYFWIIGQAISMIPLTAYTFFQTKSHEMKVWIMVNDSPTSARNGGLFARLIQGFRTWLA